MISRRVLICGALVAISACGADGTSSGGDPPLVVSTAISVSDSLRRAADIFERSGGPTVVLNVGGSDTLATQLLGGARVDLFVSADTRQMGRVEAGGGILTPTRVNLFTNQLVVITHVDDVGMVSQPSDLAGERVRRIAMGDPDAVPAGVYARQFLRTVGLWGAVQPKVAPTRDVRAALAAVAAGNADVGLVYRTDLALAEDVEMAFAIPIDAGPPIRYVAAVTSDTTQEAAARRLLAFLLTDTARQIFEDAGFIALEDGSS